MPPWLPTWKLQKATQIKQPIDAEQRLQDMNRINDGMDKKLNLFRQEALDYKRDTWLGDILISRPTSFAYLAWLFFIISLATLAYLIWGEYTKKARVTGYLVPDQGLIKIYVQQPGTITELRIKEGQGVKKGDVL